MIMKTYKTPTCDITNIATANIMASSMRVFDKETDDSDYLIMDSSEILGNNNKLWDEPEEDGW